MSLTNLFSTLKGSSRSGNRGHAGRPGKRGGSAPSSGLAFYQNELREYNKISEGRERHMAIDSKGNKVMDVVGQLHGVTISGQDVENLDNLKGNFVDMHNHPNDNLPSSADYNFWLRFQPAEARVVSLDGTHILKPKGGVWFPGVRKDSYYADEMVTHYMSPQYYQSHGLVYPGEHNQKILQKNALNILVEEGWLDYEFIPS